jgi:hypothetical protein
MQLKGFIIVVMQNTYHTHTTPSPFEAAQHLLSFFSQSVNSRLLALSTHDIQCKLIEQLTESASPKKKHTK